MWIGPLGDNYKQGGACEVWRLAVHWNRQVVCVATSPGWAKQ